LVSANCSSTVFNQVKRCSLKAQSKVLDFLELTSAQLDGLHVAPSTCRHKTHDAN